MTEETASTYILEVADALTNNHAALMVGAGFSKNAEKISVTEKEFLNWDELSNLFYEELCRKSPDSEEKNHNPLRLAQEVESLLGRPQLENLIKEAVPDLDYAPSDLYVTLLELPWRDVFTTNYDTLLERAAEKVTKNRYNVVVCEEDIVNSNDAPRIIKLHGSLSSHPSFIITEEDYRKYPTEHAALVNTVQQALLENVFCMLGFSCEDPNFVQWIGWIRDNLGKNNAQKIYMVSVIHVSKARQKLMFDQNILVVDLEERWPSKTKEERLRSFLDILVDAQEKKDKKQDWFDIEQVSFESDSDYVKRTETLKKFNESYPGWIFLPWKLKSKVSLLFSKIGLFYKFKDISVQEKINFMYEYVRFCDIVGRPLIYQVVEKFRIALKEHEGDVSDKEGLRKIQVIYLQLLRSYRELAEWDDYDECRKKIDETFLDYDNKQFLMTCDWWNSLYRFQSDDLVFALNHWELAPEDVYWPLIKGGLYALIGETSKAEKILIENLTVVRRALFKTNQKEYFSSIEESLVSLINFIRRGTFNLESEECIYKSGLSLWDENDKYCLTLKAEEQPQKDFEIEEKFDLSHAYRTHYGTDNAGVFHAMEYLRFLEQTGQSFRLQNATNTKGMYSTIKILAPYYPHWCLMHMLMARDTTMLDSLFGRAKLADLTQENIDVITEEYLDVIRVVAYNARPDNSSFARSIFNQAAAVLPEIVARLCYKCSTDMLDKILDVMLDICLSNIRKNFKRFDITFRGLIHSYTVQEQEERIETILKFPMEIDRANHYFDPAGYLSKPTKKISLTEDFYNNEIFQIKRNIDSSEDEKRDGAINRFIILAQLVNLTQEDEEFLYSLLENMQSSYYNSILYELNPKKYSGKLKEIFDFTLQKMQQDSRDSGFAVRGSTYEDLIEILRDINIKDVNIANVFSVMANLISTNVPWAQDNQFEADARIRESFVIASGLLVLKNIAELVLVDEEQVQINLYLSELSRYLPGMDVIKILWSCIGVDIDITYNKSFENVYISENEELEYVRYFYDELYANEFVIKGNENLLKCSDFLFEMAICRAANNEPLNVLPSLKLCYSLLQNKIFSETRLDLLLAVLSKMQKSTIISKDDPEEVAKYKLRCRVEACKIAAKLYAIGMVSKILEQWRKISKDKNEYSEIRNIVFIKSVK